MVYNLIFGLGSLLKLNNFFPVTSCAQLLWIPQNCLSVNKKSHWVVPNGSVTRQSSACLLSIERSLNTFYFLALNQNDQSHIWDHDAIEYFLFLVPIYMTEYHSI